MSDKPPTVTVGPTSDVAYMDSVLRQPDIYESISHDASPPAEKLTVGGLVSAGINRFLLVSVDGEPAGFFMLVNRCRGVYEVHTNLTMKCRGKLSVRAGIEGCKWMFLNTDAMKLVSFCPSCSPETSYFASLVGFNRDFTQTDRWVKHGKKHDVIHVSLTFDEWLRIGLSDFGGNHYSLAAEILFLCGDAYKAQYVINDFKARF